MKSTFSLLGYDLSGARTFNLVLELDAKSPHDAARSLGCGILETPTLEAKIILAFIAEARKNPSIDPQLLVGRPSAVLLARLMPQIDGELLLAVQDAWRVFVTPGTMS